MKTRGGIKLEGFRVTIDIPVIFRDLDAFGHVNNAVYLTYLENARVAYLERIAGGGLESLRLIIAEITMTYRSPAHFGESLRVGIRVSEVGNSSFIMQYRIEDQKTGRLVAEARSTQVAFDYEAGRPMPVPAEWRHAMEKIEGLAPGAFSH
ncbi:MAG: acyl-CoA thioesterase [Firmicutes bacterium]|nr:acyl-CoA thioesterase [Bacillota bacterium]